VFIAPQVMKKTETNYDRIAAAIEYIKQNFKSQPDLDTIAQSVHLSPFHFQRIFSEWAGVSPKTFLQYISVEYAKRLLRVREASLFDVAYETGLSGTSRLHDLFVKMEAMTPAEYKNGGKSLAIQYSFSPCKFGDVLIASTQKGICAITFADQHEEALELLKQQFPYAHFTELFEEKHKIALSVLMGENKNHPIHLHVKGTDFQLKVWEALLKIPMGKLSTYGSIAEQIENPKASRAVGTAIGSNPIAFLIPCHRVIQSSGILGGYMWGTTRKTAIIGWEAAKVNGTKP
jgi:AraC family transcriptional regulator, regulatory protein of adaptative response / methylated-DNA-[protein]-cysteine methyltransferase